MDSKEKRIELKEKQYELDMKKVGAKSKKLETALRALHEGDNKYEMMGNFMKSHDLEKMTEKDLEDATKSVEARVAAKKEAKAPKAAYELAADGSGRSVTAEENLAMVKDMWENRNNR